MGRAAAWPPGPPPSEWHCCAPSWEEEEKREIEEWAAKERIAERFRRQAAARVLQYRRELFAPKKKWKQVKGVNDRESVYRCTHRKLPCVPWPNCSCHHCTWTCPTQRAAAAAALAVVVRTMVAPDEAWVKPATRRGARRRRRQKQECPQEPPAEHPEPEKQSPPRPAAVPQRRLPPPPSASRPEAAPPAHRAVAPAADAPPVTVSIRIRDLLFAERSPSGGGTMGIVPVGNTVATTAGGVSTAVTVDKVLNSVTGLGLERSGAHSGQPEVFEALGQPLLTAALEGRVASLIACGPSGSGKSYSIFGPAGDPGVVPRLLDALFASGKVSYLTVEALCVYQSAVYCLLREAEAAKQARGARSSKRWPRLGAPDFEAHWGPDAHAASRYEAARRAARWRKAERKGVGRIAMGTAPLALAQSADGQCSVVGARQCDFSSAGDALSAVRKAAKRRPTARTPFNATSSRGHLVLRLKVHLTSGQCALLFVADLAGGERLHAVGAPPQRLRESRAINTELLSLRRCVAAHGRGELVPHRDAKLTRVLSIADCQVEWLTTLSPAAADAVKALVAMQEAEAARDMARMRDRQRQTWREIEAARKEQEEQLAEHRAMLTQSNASAAACLTAAIAGMLSEERVKEWRAEVLAHHAPAVAVCGGALAAACGLLQRLALREELVAKLKQAKSQWQLSYQGAVCHLAEKGMRNEHDPSAHPTAVLQAIWAVMEKKKAREERKTDPDPVPCAAMELDPAAVRRRRRDAYFRTKALREQRRRERAAQG